MKADTDAAGWKRMAEKWQRLASKADEKTRRAERQRDAALSRVKALEERLAEEATRDVLLERMGPGRMRDGRPCLSMTLSDARGVVLRIAEALVTYFKGEGGTNYVEVKVRHPDEGAFVLCLQREAGKTPAELQRKAESERDEAVEWIGVVREELVRAGGAGGDRAVGLANLRAVVAERDALRAQVESARPLALSALSAVPFLLGTGSKVLDATATTLGDLAAALSASPVSTKAEDRRKPCTCSSSGDYCRVAAGGVLGDLWRCDNPPKPKPTPPQPHGCPMGDVCPVCDEPEVSR